MAKISAVAFALSLAVALASPPVEQSEVASGSLPEEGSCGDETCEALSLRQLRQAQRHGQVPTVPPAPWSAQAIAEGDSDFCAGKVTPVPATPVCFTHVVLNILTVNAKLVTTEEASGEGKAQIQYHLKGNPDAMDGCATADFTASGSDLQTSNVESCSGGTEKGLKVMKAKYCATTKTAFIEIHDHMTLALEAKEMDCSSVQWDAVE